MTAISESVNETIYIRGVWTGDLVHSSLFSSVLGRGGVQKNSPRHTHILKRLKKKETCSWNFSMEAENVQWINVLLVSFENVNDFPVASWSPPPPPCVHLKGFPLLSGPLLYLCIWTLNFKIANQKVAHTCVNYFVFTDLVLREKQHVISYISISFFCKYHVIM